MRCIQGHCQFHNQPLPELAEDLAVVVINNQDEIERTLVLARKMQKELTIVFKKHQTRVKIENKELDALVSKFVDVINKRWN